MKLGGWWAGMQLRKHPAFHHQVSIWEWKQSSNVMESHSNFSFISSAAQTSHSWSFSYLPLYFALSSKFYYFHRSCCMLMSYNSRTGIVASQKSSTCPSISKGYIYICLVVVIHINQWVKVPRSQRTVGKPHKKELSPQLVFSTSMSQW